MNININLSRRVLKKIIKYLILFLLGCIAIFYVNTLNVKAETINNTSSSINEACSTNSRFTYSLINNSNFSTGTFSTTYSGVADYFVFSFNYSLLGNSTYSLSISANGQDFRNISKTNTFLYNVSSCADVTTQLDITNVSFSLSKIVITFKTISNSSRFLLAFGSDGGPAITGVSNFGISSIDITTIESDDTKNIIDNNNQNTQSIIDNNDQNTQDIIDNQNKNNEELKDTIQDGLQDCYQKNLLDKTKYVIKGSVVGLDLSLLKKGKTYTFSSNRPIEELKISESRGGVVYPDLYKWVATTGFTEFTFTWPTDKDPSTMYLWLYLPPNDTIVSNISQLDGYNLQIEEGTSATSYVEPGEVCTNKLDETNDKLADLNDNITSSDISGADDEASDFFNDFENNDFGLSDILTLPLTTIESITSKTCSPLSLTLPFVNKTFELPCMTTIYSKFEPFYSIYKTITFGIVAYWICVQIYAMVKGFKDPTSDEIEVMDL